MKDHGVELEEILKQISNPLYRECVKRWDYKEVTVENLIDMFERIRKEGKFSQIIDEKINLINNLRKFIKLFDSIYFDLTKDLEQPTSEKAKRINAINIM